MGDHNINQQLIDAIENKNYQFVDILLNNKQIDLTYRDYRILMVVINNDEIDILKRILKMNNLSEDIYDFIVHWTFMHIFDDDDREMINLLLDNPNINPNILIENSSRIGLYHDITISLLKNKQITSATLNDIFLTTIDSKVIMELLNDDRVDVNKYGIEALKFNLEFNHDKEEMFEIVKVMILDPRIDLSAENNILIKIAKKFGYHHIIKLFLLDDKVNKSLNPSLLLLTLKFHFIKE